MNKLTSVAGAGITALALGLALVGCGSDSSTEATSSSSSSSSEEETATSSAEETAAEEPGAPAEATGANQTIQDYVRENGIQETLVKRGDPGPVVDLPVPEGWIQNDELPEAPYGAIIFGGTAVPNNPPRILSLMSKLTGNVDPEQILEYAPGELNNMPGYSAANEGMRDTLSGFDSYQLGGTYEMDGKKGMIAQKTVVIPAADGVYVLQLNAYSDESEANILADATTIIDEQTTITPLTLGTIMTIPGGSYPDEPPPPERGLTREERGRDISDAQAQAEAQPSGFRRILAMMSPKLVWSMAEGYPVVLKQFIQFCLVLIYPAWVFCVLFYAVLYGLFYVTVYPVLWVLFWPMRAWMKKNRPDEYAESQRKK